MADLKTDRDLLQAYARGGSESAFQALVERHLDLVFATVLRGVSDPGAAEEITQNVFVALGRKAAWLSGESGVADWLHRTALFEVKRWWRGELRRRRREQTAVELGTVMKDEDSLLKALAGELDEGLLELRKADRQALLLRYFEGRTHREIGALLGTREDAVRMRIGKALDHLTQFFRRRGYAVPAVTTTAAAMGAAAKAAPAGLAIAATRSALSASGSASGGLKLLLARFLGLTKTQTTVLCVAIAAAPVASQWTEYRLTPKRGAVAATQMAGLRAAGHDGPAFAVGGASDPEAEPAFRWAEIESSDYRQYVANLRAIGCPQQVIRDIIMADLNQLYAKRREAIVVPAYWQKPKRQGSGPAPIKIMAWGLEQSELAKELLGFPPNAQDFAQTLLLQLQRSEEQLLFLPDNRRVAALQALSDAGLDAAGGELPAAKARSGRLAAGDVDRDLFDRKLKALASVLSPDELEEFNLYNSPGAQALRAESGFFDWTPEEFKAVLKLRQQRGGGDSPYPDLLNRAAAGEDLRQALGDDRAGQFERVTDLCYITARTTLEAGGLPIESADQAWQICHDARAGAEQVAGDSSLPVEERQNRIQALSNDAGAQLIQLMGGKAAGPVWRNLRALLTATAQRVRP
jgi:RNA polymerase sigma factor (sigma-70 family)